MKDLLNKKSDPTAPNDSIGIERGRAGVVRGKLLSLQFQKGGYFKIKEKSYHILIAI